MSIRSPRASDPALPGTIRAAISHPAGGTIAMSGFPGLDVGMDGEAVFLPEACLETLGGLQALGADHLTLLVEDDELEQIFFDGIERCAQDLGLALKRFPISDYSVPDDAAKATWEASAEARGALLRDGGTLAYACQHGAGRSGLMAAWTLIEGGVSPQDAINLVRSHFSEAVESEAQELWLLSLAQDDVT